jgi:hypothetical protein
VPAVPLREGTAVVGAATIIHDVTGSVRSWDAEQLLGAANERVGSTLDVMRTAQELASRPGSAVLPPRTSDAEPDVFAFEPAHPPGLTRPHTRRRPPARSSRPRAGVPA